MGQILPSPAGDRHSRSHPLRGLQRVSSSGTRAGGLTRRYPSKCALATEPLRYLALNSSLAKQRATHRERGLAGRWPGFAELLGARFRRPAALAVPERAMQGGGVNFGRRKVWSVTDQTASPGEAYIPGRREPTTNSNICDCVGVGSPGTWSCERLGSTSKRGSCNLARPIPRRQKA